MVRKVNFYSDGLKIAGILFEPDDASDKSCSGIVMCQEGEGNKEYYWFPYIARRFMDLGYVVLIWDYRGTGESEGEHGRVYPLERVEDIRNALTYLEVHPKVDPERLALYRTTYGGAVAAYVASTDERVKCTISVSGWSDGEREVRSLRRYGEWLEFLEKLHRDRKSQVLTGKSDRVVVGKPFPDETRDRVINKIPGMENYNFMADHGKKDPISWAARGKMLEFKPIEVADRISPRAILYIAAEKDPYIPLDQVTDIYERTKEPKKLWVILGISHWHLYEELYVGQIFEQSSDWLRQHLT